MSQLHYVGATLENVGVYPAAPPICGEPARRPCRTPAPRRALSKCLCYLRLPAGHYLTTSSRESKVLTRRRRQRERSGPQITDEHIRWRPRPRLPASVGVHVCGRHRQRDGRSRERLLVKLHACTAHTAPQDHTFARAVECWSHDVAFK